MNVVVHGNSPLKDGAEDGDRTRDVDFGKVVLYQLSYFRAMSEDERDSNPLLPPRPGVLGLQAVLRR